MGRIKVSKESFDSYITQLESTKTTLEKFDGTFVDDLIEKLNLLDSNFITEYTNSMTLVKNELDKTVTTDLELIIATTRTVIENYTYVDSELSSVVENDGGNS